MQEAARRIFWHGKSSEYWGLCFTAEEPNVVVNMTKVGSPPSVTLEYSTNGIKWLPFDANNGTTPITLKKTGSKVFFRAGLGGNIRLSSNQDKYRTFTCSGRCAASGNIMSLLNAENENNTTLTGDYTFYCLFNGCPITTAPLLPADNIFFRSYSFMFQNCAALVHPPIISATVVRDYGCRGMFQNCTALAYAPDLLPTTLTQYCY